MTMQCSGAYSRRKFSNYTVAGDDSGLPSGYTISASCANPEMGSVGIVKLTDGGLAADSKKRSSIRSGEAYPAGTAFRAVASPLVGYEFVKWETNLGTGSAVFSTPSIDFKLDRNVILCARFKKKEGVTPEKTLNVRWDGKMGRVTSSSSGYTLGSESPACSGSITAPEGTSVKLTAEAKDGYRFVRWEGVSLAGNTQKNDSPSITINMRDASIKAVFASENSGGNGSNAGNGGGSNAGDYFEPSGFTSVAAGSAKKGFDVMAAIKKWWWVAILAYIVYKETKGGSK